MAMGKEARTMSLIRPDRAHLAHGPLFPPRAVVDPARRGTLSIIVPAKDEAANLPELVAEVVEVFRPRVGRADCRHRLHAFEVVVVDDGSTDRTVPTLRRLARIYPELRPVFLARNVGQSAATFAGFWAARGDWVGLLDGDLQNPPSDLAALWEALPGYDAALGWRRTREDIWTKRAISRLANWVRNVVLGQSIRDTGCSIRIFPREVALRLPMFRGAHRFFGPLLIREGCRIVQKPVGHRPRFYGESHYHFGNRSLRVVVDLLGVAWLLARPIRFEVVSPPVVGGRSSESRLAAGWEALR
jgi:glycosyltransferase involved in cell wall biosynthesis